MSLPDPNKFVYFSPVEGRVVPRYGSAGYIGATYKANFGFEIDPQIIVRIPELLYRQHQKAWRRAVKDGSLIERTEREYIEYVASSEAKSAEDAQPSQSQQEKTGSDDLDDLDDLPKKGRGK